MAKQAQRKTIQEIAREQVGVLNKEVDAVHDELEPHYAERDRIFDKINKLQEELQPHLAEIKRIEAESLIPLRAELKLAADASGGKTLSDNRTT